MILTNEILNEIFIADFENGKLFWRDSGKQCNTLRKPWNYACVEHNGKCYRVHRILYQLFHGSSPKCVDHINGDGSDNRILNLRGCSIRENVMNAKLNISSTTGFKGVSYRKDHHRFVASITVNGKKLHIKNCISAEEAAAQYDLSAIKHFGEFAKTNKKLGLL